jgi:hypothetical protein
MPAGRLSPTPHAGDESSDRGAVARLMQRSYSVASRIYAPSFIDPFLASIKTAVHAWTDSSMMRRRHSTIIRARAAASLLIWFERTQCSTSRLIPSKRSLTSFASITTTSVIERDPS